MFPAIQFTHPTPTQLAALFGIFALPVGSTTDTDRPLDGLAGPTSTSTSVRPPTPGAERTVVSSGSSAASRRLSLAGCRALVECLHALGSPIPHHTQTTVGVAVAPGVGASDARSHPPPRPASAAEAAPPTPTPTPTPTAEREAPGGFDLLGEGVSASAVRLELDEGAAAREEREEREERDKPACPGQTRVQASGGGGGGGGGGREGLVGRGLAALWRHATTPLLPTPNSSTPGPPTLASGPPPTEPPADTAAAATASDNTDTAVRGVGVDFVGFCAWAEGGAVCSDPDPDPDPDPEEKKHNSRSFPAAVTE
jgi:hypothetical protein